jgi:hypothetical protein
MKRLVFLFDSTVEPWGLDLQAIRSALGRLEGKPVECEVVDTHGMAHEQLEYWFARLWQARSSTPGLRARRAGTSCRLPA